MRKRIFKLLFIFALFFGFSTALASCNKTDDSKPVDAKEEKKDDDKKEEDKPLTPVTPEPEILEELPEDYYEKLISFEGINSANITITNLKVKDYEIDEASYIDIKVQNETLFANGLIHIIRPTEEQGFKAKEHASYYFSLDDEELVAYTKSELKDLAFNEVILDENDNVKTYDELNNENVIWQKITISKTSILQMISNFASGAIGAYFGGGTQIPTEIDTDALDGEELDAEVDVTSNVPFNLDQIDLTQIKLPSLSFLKPLVAKIIGAVCNVAFTYTFTDNQIKGDLSYTLLNVLVNVINRTTLGSIFGEQLAVIEEAFNPENPDRVTTVKVSEVFERYNLTRENIELIYELGIALLERAIDAGIEIPEILRNPSMLAFVVIAGLELDYDRIGEEFKDKVDNGEQITLVDVLFLEEVQEYTLNEIYAKMRSFLKPILTNFGIELEDLPDDFDLATKVYETVTKIKNYNLYDLIVNFVEGKTKEELQTEVTDFVQNLPEKLKVSFTTDNTGKLKTISCEFNFKDEAQGKIYVDFATAYKDEAKAELEPMKDKAAKSSMGSTELIDDLITEAAFEDLEGYSTIKNEAGQIIGFKVIETRPNMSGESEAETEQLERTFYLGKAENLELEESDVFAMKTIMFGSYYKYTISTKVLKKVDSVEQDDSNYDSISLIYNSSTNKFVIFTYELKETIGEAGNCEAPLIQIYQNTDYENDVYYKVTYTPHEIAEYNVLEKDNGRYDIYFVCGECENEYIFQEDQDEYFKISDGIFDVEDTNINIQLYYYIVKNETTFVVTPTYHEIEVVDPEESNVEEDEPLDLEDYEEYLEGLTVTNSFAYRYRETEYEGNQVLWDYYVIYINEFEKPEPDPNDEFAIYGSTEKECLGVLIVNLMDNNPETKIIRLGAAVLPEA